MIFEIRGYECQHYNYTRYLEREQCNTGAVINEIWVEQESGEVQLKLNVYSFITIDINYSEARLLMLTVMYWFLGPLS